MHQYELADPVLFQLVPGDFSNSIHWNDQKSNRKKLIGI